ncbi:hypothetical protein SUDANB70_02365 [Streptomyces sp. enrichment culture]
MGCRTPGSGPQPGAPAGHAWCSRLPNRPSTAPPPAPLRHPPRSDIRARPGQGPHRPGRPAGRAATSCRQLHGTTRSARSARSVRSARSTGFTARPVPPACHPPGASSLGALPCRCPSALLRVPRSARVPGRPTRTEAGGRGEAGEERVSRNIPVLPRSKAALARRSAPTLMRCGADFRVTKSSAGRRSPNGRSHRNPSAGFPRTGRAVPIGVGAGSPASRRTGIHRSLRAVQRASPGQPQPGEAPRRRHGVPYRMASCDRYHRSRVTRDLGWPWKRG